MRVSPNSRSICKYSGWQVLPSSPVCHYPRRVIDAEVELPEDVLARTYILLTVTAPENVTPNDTFAFVSVAIPVQFTLSKDPSKVARAPHTVEY